MGLLVFLSGGPQPLRSPVLALSANDLRATCFITQCFGSPTVLNRSEYLVVDRGQENGVLVNEVSVRNTPGSCSEEGAFSNH